MGGDRPPAATSVTPAESPPGGCPVHSAAESGLRTLGIRSRKGDFRFGELDRHGADKRGARNGEYVKRDRWFESVSLQQRVMQTIGSSAAGPSNRTPPTKPCSGAGGRS